MTVRQTDRFAISISRVSMLTRDKKHYTLSIVLSQGYKDIPPSPFLSRVSILT